MKPRPRGLSRDNDTAYRVVKMREEREDKPMGSVGHVSR